MAQTHFLIARNSPSDAQNQTTFLDDFRLRHRLEEQSFLSSKAITNTTI
jgi:hypothetical protein